MPVFRNLSILAKSYMVKNFEMIKLGLNQRYEIPDVNKVDFYFVMEGRLKVKCMNLQPDSNDDNEEVVDGTLIANDYLTK